MIEFVKSIKSNRFAPLALGFQLGIDTFELGIAIGAGPFAVIPFVHTLLFREYQPVLGAHHPADLPEDGAFSLSSFHHRYL